MSKSSKRHRRIQANNNTSSSRASKQRATVTANPTARESNEEATDTRSKAAPAPAPTKTKAGENNEADTRDTRTREILEISNEINIPKTTKMANVLTSKEIDLGVAIRTVMETEATDVLLRITTIVVRSTRCQRLIMTRTTVSSTLRTLSSSLK